MANRRNGSNRNSTGRSRLASFLLVMMPGFMFLGLLAPGAVTVQEEQEEVELPLVFRDFQLPTRKPLVGDHVTVDASVTEVAAIREVLGAGVRLIASRAKDSLDVLDFELQAEEDIVLESDVDEQETVQELLDPALTPAVSQNVLVAETNQLLDNERFGIIPGPLRTNGDRPDDDFAGDALTYRNPVPQPVEVPEPASGALLALGIAGLAMSRKAGVLPRS